MTEDQQFIGGLCLFGLMILFVLFSLIGKRGAEFEPLDEKEYKRLKGEDEE